MPKLRGAVPVLGLCYGHQLLAKLLPGGGTVGPVWEGGKACVGLRRLELAPDQLWNDRPTAGFLVCSHKEGVTKLPAGMRSLATVHRGGVQGASSTFVDAMRHQTLPIWGFQPHCEATDAFLQNNGVMGLTPQQRDAALPFGQSIVDEFVVHCVSRVRHTNAAGDSTAGHKRSRM